MSEGTITGTVITPIILGQGAYATDLIVSASGAVQPTVSGAAAITGPTNLGSASLINYGDVLGANANKLNNGAGGDGVLLGAAASVTNSGSITGGGGIGSSANQGGAGIAFEASGTLTNTGQIVAGYDARAAVVFFAAAHVTNSGTIDGDLSAAGLVLGDGGALANTGLIQGGLGSDSNSATNGRAGLLVNGSARIFNGGEISGGYGASLASGTAGSGAGGSGGIGIVLQGSGSICDNAGAVTGGGGGGSGAFNPSGNGGAGAVVETGNLLVNSGDIGGGGGAGAGLYSGTPGVGGAGAVVLGGELFNLGVIAGGAGGLPREQEGSTGWTFVGQGGAGGDGVLVSSGRLVAAAGTISGGASGEGYAGPSTGLAVAFGNRLPATLVVDPGAAFVGGVEASTSVADTLALGGTASGTLGGFGEIGGIRNFADIAEGTGSHWLLSGGFTSTENLSMGANAFLALDGPVSGSVISFAQSGGDTLSIEAPSTFSGQLSSLGSGDVIQLAGVDATSLAYENDVVTLLGSDGATLSTLTFAGNYTASNFHLEAMSGAIQIDFIPSAH